MPAGSKSTKFFKYAFFVAIILIIFALLISLIIPGSDRETRVLYIAAASAFFAAISSIGSLWQSIEIRKQRENQERPYVIGYFESSASGLINFFIENRGNSPATDIQIKIDPDPVTFRGDMLSTYSLFNRPISFMEPRKVFRQAIWMSHQLFEGEHPLEFKTQIFYKSIMGAEFKENYNFDLSGWKNAQLPFKTERESLESIADHLKTINDQLKQIKL